MIKILDLFAGTQSVRKAVETMGIEFDYIGVDIYSPEKENLIIDLSQKNIVNTIIDKLPKGWKPDFIWASPLCTTFSRATCIPGGTLSYELDKNDRVILRKNFAHITHKSYVALVNDYEWQQLQREKGRLGLNLLNNTKEIIDFFKVPFAIENPAYALSRKELTEYTRTVTAYCMYGKPYKKPTAIYTNTPLTLKKCNHKGGHAQVMSGNPTKTGKAAAPSSNKDRSVVPEELIIEIISQSIEVK